MRSTRVTAAVLALVFSAAVVNGSGASELPRSPLLHRFFDPSNPISAAEYDDEYYQLGSAELSHQLRGSETKLADWQMRVLNQELFSNMSETTHRVQLHVSNQNELHVFASGPSSSLLTSSGGVSSRLTALHHFLTTCHMSDPTVPTGVHPHAWNAARRAAAASGLRAQHCQASRALQPKAGSDDAPAPQAWLRLAYAAAHAPSDAEHHQLRRKLQDDHPGAAIHTRRLSAPRFGHPLLRVTRRTRPVHASQRLYRHLAEAAHPLLGNISIAYVVQLKESTVVLDDLPEVLSVSCDRNEQMVVRTLLPVPFEVGVSVEGDAGWGCAIGGEPMTPGQAPQDTGSVLGAFVVQVNSVSHSVRQDGVHEYSLSVVEEPPFAAATVFDMAIESHLAAPENRQEAVGMARAAQEIDPPCSRIDYGASATPPAAGFDLKCTVDPLFGNWGFNWNFDTNAVKETKLYPISNVESVYFENTYAKITNSLELEVSAYMAISAPKMRRFRVVINGGLDVQVKLAVEFSGSSSSGPTEWSELIDRLDLGSLSFMVGPLPVTMNVKLAPVAKFLERAETPVKISTGASANANAQLGVDYRDRLVYNEKCECVGPCTEYSSTFGGYQYHYCFVNAGCSDSAAIDDGLMEKYMKGCDSGWKSDTSGGFESIAQADWDFSYQPLTATAENAGKEFSATQELAFGAKIILTLYKLVPVSVIPHLSMKLQASAEPTSGQRRLGASVRRDLEESCDDFSGQVEASLGKTDTQLGIGDIALKMPSAISTFTGDELTFMDGKDFGTVPLSTYKQTFEQPILYCPEDIEAAEAAAAAAAGQSSSDSSSDSSGGLGTGGKVGISIGVIAGVAAAAIGIAIAYNKSKRSGRAHETSRSTSQATTQPASSGSDAPVTNVSNPLQQAYTPSSDSGAQSTAAASS